mmetsp:Transcript_11897/g.29300  ORF Transcript_11897/g.29300 Transcript_11897/m.29300 type:complete len:292 (-) Transcript_11897:289-1164(-)|eukprot:CAMPEP_0114513264 /NCGR_PEP_ID=MMETSP0109-20121206/15463_1 /TAXON_ID=29199 /ORGANISM="Chlorarachnion reptans, Strain CCCM449" /LENGTH=291 /DNA_ID=CAMNT_0001693097 /DNA_START=199 /DNA_END=1074 /DNA_ORIENTATION=+
MSNATFKYVYVPAEKGAPMEVLEASKPDDLQDDTFTTTLKKHFSSRGKVDRKILEAQISEKIKGQKLDEKQIEMLMGHTSVEINPITVPTQRNNFLSVSMYVDDQGIAKSLPLNERASQIALASGRASEVRGDAFFGRIFDDQNVWTREDFTLADCRSDAPWIAAAKKESLRPKTSDVELQKMLAKAQTKELAEKKFPEGSTGRYSWNQKEDEVEIVVPVPEGCSSKDVKMGLKSKSIVVALKGQVILEGDLFQTVRTDGSTWSISGDGNSRKLSIVLEKAMEKTWSALLK